MELTSKQRAQLRGMASTLDTIIHIGKDRIGDNLVKQANDALEARELIKGRVLENSMSRVYNPRYFPSEKTVCSRRLAYAEKWGKEGELLPGVRLQTYKIMREVARKLLISDQPWPVIRQEMEQFRKDAFFRKYYLEAKDAPDKRDLVLKGPYVLMRLAKAVYRLKKRG